VLNDEGIGVNLRLSSTVRRARPEGATSAAVSGTPSLPSGWSRRLYAIIAGLLAVSLAVRLLAVATDLDFRGLNSLQKWFNVDAEANIPSWFSCVLLFACAQVMWMLAQRRPGESRRWQLQERVLAAVFIYLSIDELTSLHEQIEIPVRNAFDLTGAFYFAWVVVAVPLVLIFALFMLGYLRALPRVTRRYFVVAGLLYVGGAAGLEMIGSLLWTSGSGEGSVPYILETIVEEGLEMCSLVLFIGAAHQQLRHRRAASAPGVTTSEREEAGYGG
jgi:hypothetical protein